MTDITFSIADYPEIRNRIILLHTKIYNKLSPEDIKICGCNLDVWIGNGLAIDSEQELNLFADYAIYAYRPKGFNMAENFLRFFIMRQRNMMLALLGICGLLTMPFIKSKKRMAWIRLMLRIYIVRFSTRL